MQRLPLQGSQHGADVADALRDPRRGSTCGASASRPTCRSGRPLEDLRTGQVVCSVEVPVASRQPSRTCAMRANAAVRPHASCADSATSVPAPKPPRRGLSAPAPAHESRRPAFPCSQKVACLAYGAARGAGTETWGARVGSEVVAIEVARAHEPRSTARGSSLRSWGGRRSPVRVAS
jgi:hypothetical protein